MEQRQVKKGDIVMWVHKIDTDPTDSIPNVSPAIVNKVRPAVDGKPENISVAVFPGGAFVIDHYVTYDANKSRGTWHFREDA